MNLLRYLYRSINLSNIILVIAIILVAAGAFSPYLYRTVRVKLPPAGISPAEEEEKPVESASLSVPDYMVVGEQNLFHPDRRIPPETKDGRQLPRPELILYGTLIYGGTTVAYLEDKKNPITSPGRGKRQTVMKKGEAISGFVLKEVKADHIVLLRGDEKMVVRLSQSDKPRTTERSMGSLPVSGGAAAGSKAVGRQVTPIPSRRVVAASPRVRPQDQGDEQSPLTPPVPPDGNLSPESPVPGM